MESILKQRAISAFIFVVVVVSLFCVGNFGAMALLAAIVPASLYEFGKMQKKEGLALWLPVLWGLSVIAFLYFADFRANEFNSVAIIASVSYLMTGLFILLPRIPLTSWVSNTVYFYPVVGAALWIKMLALEPEMNIVLLLVLCLLWANDTGAYLVGRRWGKNKLYEIISPKKTWEGFAGGLLFTMLTAGGIHFTKWGTETNWFLVGVLAAVLGTMGDLVQSKIKRENNVKDSGNIMPGHGGIWDRFDSFLFYLPFALLLVLAF